MTIVTGENTIPKIESLYAFFSVDENGNEGLCAFEYKPGHWLPLIAADEKRVTSLVPIAQEIAINSKKEVVLVKLFNREKIHRFPAEK